MSDYRQITQIAVTNDHETGDAIYALCNDGTVWCRADNIDWLRLPQIPQPKTPCHETP
jgi:hypothetical protein